MQAESGQLPSFTESLNSSSPTYATSPSITDFLNASRVALIKKKPKTQIPQRVFSPDTGVLLPILQQPAGIPRPPCSEYDPSDKDLRKTTRRHKPKFAKSKRFLAHNPSLLIDEKCLVEMWGRYPSHRDLMTSARRHLVRVHDSLQKDVEIAALEVGIRPGTPRAAEIAVPKTKWERVRRKMDRLRRKWGLGLVVGDQQKDRTAAPVVAVAKTEKVAKPLNGLEDIAESENEDDEDVKMGNVLPSVEVGG